MTVIVSDSFNRADNANSLGVADTGQNWQYSTGDVFGIMSNSAYCVSGTNPTIAYIDSSQSDVSVKVIAVQSSTSDYFMAVFRYNPTNNSGILLHGNPIKLQTFTNSTYTTIAQPATTTYNAAGDIFQIDLNGTTIDIYRNDIKLFTATSTFNQTATCHGFGSWHGATSGGAGRWDDFSISSLSTSGTMYTSSLSDLISTSDFISRNLTIVVADNITSGDTTSEIKGKDKNLTDSVILLDSISKQLNRSLTDSISTSETSDKDKYKLFNNMISPQDTLYQSSHYNKKFSDSMSFFDSITTYQGKAINLYDSISIVDAISKSLNRHVNDFISSGDGEQYVTDKTLLDVISSSDIITTNEGKSILLSDSVNLSDAINKALSQIKLDSISSSDTLTQQSHVNLQLYDVIVTTDTLNVHLPNAPTLIGTIELQGKRELNIYLKGTRQLDLNFKGVIQ